MDDGPAFIIVWSESAIADLEDICTYIARDNPEAARRMGVGVLKHVRLLASFPFIGPSYPRNAQGILREIVYRHYRIFYEVSEESAMVEILHVWHPSRDEPPI